MTKTAENEVNKVSLTKAEKLAVAKAYYEEKVTVTFPRTGNRDDNEIHVTLNGKNYIIRRGDTVTIPRAVYDVINEADRQKMNLYKAQDAKKMKSDK